MAQKGRPFRPWRTRRTCVRCGRKSAWRVAVTIAASLVIRTWRRWQLVATTRQSANSPTTSTTGLSQAGRPPTGLVALDGRTELVANIRGEEDEEDDDDADDRDGDHRELEALHVGLQWRELDLPPA